MGSLLNLVLKLKTDILEVDSDDIRNGNYLSNEDIHKIRVGIEKIEDDSIDKSQLEFINQCFGFESILVYFNNLAEGSYYDIYDHVTKALDPLCIYLMNNDYEVSVRKISVTDKLENNFPNLIDLVNSMEEAYYSHEYQRVTSLSSTILESLFKEICDLNGIKYSKNEKFPNLYSKVRDSLNLKPKDYKENEKLRKFTSKIQVVILALNEIRNLYSESHGLSQKDHFGYDSLPPHHIKLIVDSTKTIVNFFIESYAYQFESLNV